VSVAGDPARATDHRGPLPASFYNRPVLDVGRALVGCVVSHDGCAGLIVETEAYHQSEPACHAFAGLTPRTSTLFGPAGRAYVYRSYGIHALLNAVAEPQGVGAAVLIRALEPVEGLALMRSRRGIDPVQRLCSGPGKLTQALGISLQHNGCDLARGPVVISARPAAWREVEVVLSTRVGITKAPELPWRFCAAGSRFTSRPGARSARVASAPSARRTHAPSRPSPPVTRSAARPPRRRPRRDAR
jgi:DNA-3-methyladenine glycosylase